MPKEWKEGNCKCCCLALMASAAVFGGGSAFKGEDARAATTSVPCAIVSTVTSSHGRSHSLLVDFRPPKRINLSVGPPLLLTTESDELLRMLGGWRTGGLAWSVGMVWSGSRQIISFAVIDNISSFAFGPLGKAPGGRKGASWLSPMFPSNRVKATMFD